MLDPILCLPPSQKKLCLKTRFVRIPQIQLWGSLIRKSDVTFFEVGHYGSLFWWSQSGCCVEVFEELLLDADWALNAGNWMWLSASAFFHQYFRFDPDLLSFTLVYYGIQQIADVCIGEPILKFEIDTEVRV